LVASCSSSRRLHFLGLREKRFVYSARRFLPAACSEALSFVYSSAGFPRSERTSSRSRLLLFPSCCSRPSRCSRRWHGSAPSIAVGWSSWTSFLLFTRAARKKPEKQENRPLFLKSHRGSLKHRNNSKLQRRRA